MLWESFLFPMKPKYKFKAKCGQDARNILSQVVLQTWTYNEKEWVLYTVINQDIMLEANQLENVGTWPSNNLQSGNTFISGLYFHCSTFRALLSGLYYFAKRVSIY